MEKITYYRCSLCGQSFETEDECLACEKSHVVPVRIVDGSEVDDSYCYLKSYQAEVMYPRFIYVEMDNGMIVRYERGVTVSFKRKEKNNER